MLGGCCCLTGSMSEDAKNTLRMEQKANAKLNVLGVQQANEDENAIKLLLLGAGESGKSTLFKQMITLYGKGYSREEKLSFKPIIEQNTLHSIKVLIDASTDIQDKCDEETRVAEELKDIAKEISEYPHDGIIEPEIATKILQIFNDPGIQICLKNSNLFQFPDSGKYFIEKAEEIAQDEYIPSQEDVLRSRVRTTGIVETEFIIEGRTFHMFDVGGQRNERKKWIHCFENVTCVIFVAAISEYDQVLFEDEKVNRMTETLNLFDEICNSQWFTETSLILFLNKKDLFVEKIKKKPITLMFPEFEGDPNDYTESCNYIQNVFENLNRDPSKEVYTHVTCATNSDNVSHVFHSVKDTLIKRSLREGGFM